MPPPLDRAALDQLAMRYVARFAASSARLHRYLLRKCHERGWTGGAGPDDAGPDHAGGEDAGGGAAAAVATLVARCVAAGYVDDAAFAAMRGRSMTARGLGAQRVQAQLRHDGISVDADAAGAAAMAEVRAEAAASALAFARRRRLGPFARGDGPAADPLTARRAQDRAVAAFARAGHSLTLARAILAMSAEDAAADDVAEWLDAATRRD